MDVFGMSRILLLRVLLCILYLCLFGTTASNASSSKCIPRGKQPVEVEVKATTERGTAKQIYMQHGIADKNIICKSANGKTRFIYGYSLCKKAAIGRVATQNEGSEIIDAKCSWVEVDKYSYIHVSKRTVDGDSTIRTGCFPKNEKRDWYGHLMVECFISTTNNNFGKKIAFRLLHAKDQFYYIFDEYAPSNIIKTQGLKFDINDYPFITVKETDELRTTDDIFGIYGVMKPKDPKHVCQINPNTNKLVGLPLCAPALAKHRKGLPVYVMKDMNSICETVNVKRFKPEMENLLGYKFDSQVRGIKCWYSRQQTTRESQHILLTNFPPDRDPETDIQKDYYYILAPKGKRNNRNGKYDFYELVNVVKIEIIGNEVVKAKSGKTKIIS